jgi:hypothetical protein
MYADKNFQDAFVSYTAVLQNAETIFMNRNFCDLVDYARISVPDELAFEEDWMFTPVGFLFLEEPFKVPDPVLDSAHWGNDSYALRSMQERMRGKMRITAVSWAKTSTGGYYFMCYQNGADYGGEGFMPWSHFVIRTGDRVLERLHLFERTFKDEGTYVAGRHMELNHEIRWVFTALHMMNQRLTSMSKEKTSSLVRSMAMRKNLLLNPELRIVSLRRMEQERQSEGISRLVDWQWQWVVRGHWRLQPYQTLGDYKWIFIEAYVKGPDAKPLKPFGRTIFKAVR